MAKVKLGININPKAGVGEAFDPKELFEVAERADEAGLDFLSVPDIISRPVPRFDGLTYAAALAARTKRITIGTDVVMVPFRHPIELARRITTVDIISSGRFVFGAGLGWIPKEFEDVGIPFKERASRTDEILHVLKRLWTEPSVTHEGKHFRFRDVIVEPKPARKPHPPIWIGGASEASIQRAIKLGDGWGGYVWGIDDPAKWVQKIRECLKEEHRDPKTFYLSFRVDANINPNRDKAIEEARLFWESQKDSIEGGGVKTGAHDLSHHLENTGRSFEDLKVKKGAFGTPEEVVERIKEFNAMGAELVVLYLHTKDLKTQWARIEKGVLPRL